MKKYTVPFYSQHWDLDKWKELGYASHAEAKYWEESSCGILCVKMIIDAFRLKHGQAVLPSTKDLIFEAVTQGSYTDENGWKHEGLRNLMRDMGYKADTGVFKPEELKKALDEGALPIASVRWGFEAKQKKLKEKIAFWRKYGGHLIVLLGYKQEKGELTGFYVHHTSSYKEKEWADKFIPIEKFNQGFAGRGILVSEK